MKNNNNRTLEASFQQGVFDKLLSAIWIYDIDHYHIYWANQAALKMWQADSLEELINRDFKPGTSDAVQHTLRNYQKEFEQQKTISRMWQYNPKGVKKEAFCQMSSFKFDDGRIGLLCEALEPHLLGNSFNQNSVVLLSNYDLMGNFISGNPPFVQKFSSCCQNLQKLIIDDQLRESLLMTIGSNERFEMDVQVHTNTGPCWYRLIADISPEDTLHRTISVQQFDINERKLLELTFAKEAITDSLTGLLNRRGLDRELQKLSIQNEPFLIFYIDLDGFKMINDSLGHQVGDVILKAMAQRLLEIKDGKLFVCRYGGDEFILVSSAKNIVTQASTFADKLMSNLNEPYLFDGTQSLLVSVSIGITRYPEDGDDVSKLILRADAAMYSAKKKGKKRWVNYIQGMESGLQRQNEIAQRLFKALKHSNLMLYYQPIYNLELNEIDSFEALLRLNDQELGWVSPEEIVSVAEEVGIIAELEYWIIERAISDLSSLRQLTIDKAMMAINISGIHFSDPKLVPYILGLLEKYKVSKDSIIVELTESALLSDIDIHENSALRFTNAGITLSIDDFGTGFSSLAYLHKIPASIVKIDRSFTQRLEEDPSLISSIYQLIKSQGFKALVEGVETDQQSRLLKELGISLQQGYGLGFPQALSFYANQFKWEKETQRALT